MSDELKPCPWPDCGKNEATLDSVVARDLYELWAVICPHCERSVEGKDGSRQAAIDAWNALPRTVQAAPSDTIHIHKYECGHMVEKDANGECPLACDICGLERRLEESLRQIERETSCLGSMWEEAMQEIRRIARAALAGKEPDNETD